jgi:hypothetical protein
MKFLTRTTSTLALCAALMASASAAEQTIDIGTSANSGRGDPVRTAFAKANANFDELYKCANLVPGTGLSIAQCEISLNASAFDISNQGVATQPNGQVMPLAKRFSLYHDVVSDSGLVNDATSYADGTMVAGSNSLSSLSATFTPADVGKLISIDFAGPNGTPLTTIISTYVSPHIVTLRDPATVGVPYNYAYGHTYTPGAAGTNVAAGDTFQLEGGTLTPGGSKATGFVRATQVVSATIVNGGTGGVTSLNATTGNCYVQGTTGSGFGGSIGGKAVISVALTNGVITAINSVFLLGLYTTNPTDPTHEPVVGTKGCTGLTGAILNFQMGARVTGPLNKGSYAVNPTTPVATTFLTGSGSGMTVTPFWGVGGSFVYGTDNKDALTAAINQINIAAPGTGVSGGTCLHFPAGGYLVGGPLPTFVKSGCITGEGIHKSYVIAAPFAGDLFSYSGAWLGASWPLDGSIANFTTSQTGPIIKDISIIGDRTNPDNQNALMFYDRNDDIRMNSVQFSSFNGTCLGQGELKNYTEAYLRESKFRDLKVWSCGNGTHPAVYFKSIGPHSTNQLDVESMQILRFNGHGLAFLGEVAAVRMRGVRIENMPYGMYSAAGDGLHIGDPAFPGSVSDLWCDGCLINDQDVGQAAIHVDADNAADANYDIHFNGTIGGGAGYGKGLVINQGRSSEYHIGSIATWDTNVVFGPQAGSRNLVTGVDRFEQTMTYDIQGPNTPSAYATIEGNPSDGTGTFSPNAMDGSVAGGNALPVDTVDLSFSRNAPYQIPTGAHSFRATSPNSSSSGLYNTYASVNAGQFTGVQTQAFSAYHPLDNGWFGSRIMENFSLGVGFGANELQETILGCNTAATNGASCRLSSDGLATYTNKNTAAPANNSVYAALMTCTAYDSTNKTNAISWIGWGVMAIKAGSAGSIVTAAMAKPTPLPSGTVTGADLNMTTDTSLGSPNFTFNAPTVNAASWNITCHLPTVQSR